MVLDGWSKCDLFARHKGEPEPDPDFVVEDAGVLPLALADTEGEAPDRRRAFEEVALAVLPEHDGEAQFGAFALDRQRAGDVELARSCWPDRLRDERRLRIAGRVEPVLACEFRVV